MLLNEFFHHNEQCERTRSAKKNETLSMSHSFRCTKMLADNMSHISGVIFMHVRIISSHQKSRNSENNHFHFVWLLQFCVTISADAMSTFPHFIPTICKNNQAIPKKNYLAKFLQHSRMKEGTVKFNVFRTVKFCYSQESMEKSHIRCKYFVKEFTVQLKSYQK